MSVAVPVEETLAERKALAAAMSAIAHHVALVLFTVPLEIESVAQLILARCQSRRATVNRPGAEDVPSAERR
jgi:hypothetical protein